MKYVRVVSVYLFALECINNDRQMLTHKSHFKSLYRLGMNKREINSRAKFNTYNWESIKCIVFIHISKQINFLCMGRLEKYKFIYGCLINIKGKEILF